MALYHVFITVDVPLTVQGSLTSRATPTNHSAHHSLTARGRYNSVTDVNLSVISEFASNSQDFMVVDMENDAFDDLVVYTPAIFASI